jgi:nitrate reductase gamma subunit
MKGRFWNRKAYREVVAIGQQDTEAKPDPWRPVVVVCLLLLGLDVGLHLVLFDRLPQTIAVHRSVTGVVDNAGHRDLVWLGPMVHAFVIGLGLVSRRHIKPRERRLGTAVIALASLYLFSLNTLGLLSNVGNETWQRASVAGHWMLLALTLPAVVFVGGLYAFRARSCRRG